MVAIEMPVSARTAEWTAEQVAVPLEGELSKLTGLVDMTSVSSDVHCLIELRFCHAPDTLVVEATRSVVLEVWRGLDATCAEPTVSVRESRLE